MQFAEIQPTALLDICFMPISCLTYSCALKMEVLCSSETQMTYTGLHGVTSQQIIFHTPRSHDSDWDDCSLLGCDKSLPRNILSDHKGWNRKTVILKLLTYFTV
jgi:hypothetical protein